MEKILKHSREKPYRKTEAILFDGAPVYSKAAAKKVAGLLRGPPKVPRKTVSYSARAAVMMAME